MQLPKFFVVFDVESIGLHGAGFAVGVSVIDSAGQPIEECVIECPSDKAWGEQSDRDWVQVNVVPALNAWLPGGHYETIVCADPHEVRAIFWQLWRNWADKGAWLAADVAWPVEARFLAACVERDSVARAWQGPYPLVDIASVRLAAGLDPLETGPRLEREQPAHHPLADARQSARLLMEALALSIAAGARVDVAERELDAARQLVTHLEKGWGGLSPHEIVYVIHGETVAIMHCTRCKKSFQVPKGYGIDAGECEAVPTKSTSD